MPTEPHVVDGRLDLIQQFLIGERRPALGPCKDVASHVPPCWIGGIPKVACLLRNQTSVGRLRNRPRPQGEGASCLRLDGFDRKAIAHVATTEGIKSEDVQDLVITVVENGFGPINTPPKPIEGLSNNGSLIAADTNSLLRDIAWSLARRRPQRQTEWPKPLSATTSR